MTTASDSLCSSPGALAPSYMDLEARLAVAERELAEALNERDVLRVGVNMWADPLLMDRMRRAEADADALRAEMAARETDDKAVAAGALHDAEAKLAAAEARCAELEAALRDAVAYVENGDFRNGVGEFGADEGLTLWSRDLDRFRAVLKGASDV